MPLPNALAARLAKRGLITKGTDNAEEKGVPENTSNNNSITEVEEVIAENYDDQENQGNILNKISVTKLVDYEEDYRDFVEKAFMGHQGCPNKYNVYHECTSFCKERWKDGYKEPDAKYLKRKASLLLKYPLPSHWKEIYDPGTGRHYYWETDSDAVSWLPPSHPKAVISESAAQLREELHFKMDDKDSDDMKDEKQSDEEESSEESEEEIVDRRELKRRKREQIEKQRARGRIKKRENDLDPMDPASYSDVPRGGWSDGPSNEAITGADVTAAGPLYQMRPYPNPGAVLRANASKKPQQNTKQAVSKPSLPDSP